MFHGIAIIVISLVKCAVLQYSKDMLIIFHVGTVTGKPDRVVLI